MGFRLHHRQFIKIELGKAKFRSFYIPKGEKGQIKECAIYYAKGMSETQLRFYKTKELLQIHLWQEFLAMCDVVDLIHNMILRELPAAVDLKLGIQPRRIPSARLPQWSSCFRLNIDFHF